MQDRDVKPMIDQLIPEWRSVLAGVDAETMSTLLKERDLNVMRLRPPQVPADPSQAAGLAWLLVVNQITCLTDGHERCLSPCIGRALDHLSGTLMTSGIELYTGRPAREGL